MIEILNTIDSVVWGPAMIALLLGTHIFLTVRTGFIQRKLPQALRMSWGGGTSKGEGDISNFGALATALAATIGTGSIVGVATAILAGGPGAVFWMWITGVFGMATKYVEVYASVRYRVRDHAGNMLGGAMYVWERAFTRKDGTRPWWAKLGGIAFAAFAVVATIGTGSAVQATSMTGIITSSIPGIPDWAVGIAIVVLVGIVIFGGVQSISHVCEKLVPVMAVAYAGGCIVILLMNAPAPRQRDRPHLRVRLYAEGRVRRRGRLRSSDGAAIRLRPRPVLQRVGPWLRPHHRRRLPRRKTPPSRHLSP